MDDDTISRKAAVNALWKALYAYEDKTEKQFQESEDLDIYDWMVHRIFVQNMSDIDRRTILDLPSAERQKVQSNECKYWDNESNFCALYKPSTEQHEHITSEMDETFRMASEIRLAVGCNTSRECWELARKGEIKRIKHGQWIDGKCSVCEANAPYTEDGFWEETSYCPYCGAKMDKILT